MSSSDFYDKNNDRYTIQKIDTRMYVRPQIPASVLARSFSSDSISDIPDSPLSPSDEVEEATPRIPWTRKRVILSIFQSSLYYYCYVCVGFQNGIIGPLITHQQKRANVSPNQIGWILTARGFGLVFATLVSGFLYFMSKRYDGEKFKWYHISINRILVIMLLLTLISMFAIPFSTHFTLLLIVYFVQGATSGVCEVGCNLAIANVWREKVRPFMQALHFFAAGGSLVFPLLIAQIFTYVEDSWMQLLIAYVLCGSLSGLVAIPLMITPSPKERRMSPMKEKKKDGPWYYIVRFRFLRLFQRTFIQLISFSSFIFLLTAILKGIATGVYSTYGGLVFQYSQRKNLGTDVELVYLTTVFWATFALGRLIASIVEGMHLFKVNVPFCTLLSSCVAGVVLSYIVLLLFHDNVYGIWIGSIIQGVFCAPISAASMVLPQASFSIPVNAASTSMVALGSTLGELIIPTMVNVMSNFFFEDSLLVTNFTFIVIALVDVVCLFFFGKLYTYWKRKKRQAWVKNNIVERINVGNPVVGGIVVEEEEQENQEGLDDNDNMIDPAEHLGVTIVQAQGMDMLSADSEDESYGARERRASGYMYISDNSFLNRKKKGTIEDYDGEEEEESSNGSISSVTYSSSSSSTSTSSYSSKSDSSK